MLEEACREFDWVVYLGMAHGQMAIEPGCYRIGVPFLAWLFGGTEAAFAWVNFAGGVVALVAFTRWAARFSRAGAALAVFAWVVSPYGPFRYPWVYPPTVDGVTAAFFALLLLAGEGRRWMAVLALGVAGAFVREAVMVFAVALLVWGKRWYAILPAATWGAIVWGVTPLHPENYSGWVTVKTQVKMHLSHPWFFLAALWNQYGPLGAAGLAGLPGLWRLGWPARLALGCQAIAVFLFGHSFEAYLSWLPLLPFAAAFSLFGGTWAILLAAQVAWLATWGAWSPSCAEWHARFTQQAATTRNLIYAAGSVAVAVFAQFTKFEREDG